jgi:hypothetical protein
MVDAVSRTAGELAAMVAEFAPAFREQCRNVQDVARTSHASSSTTAVLAAVAGEIALNAEAAAETVAARNAGNKFPSVTSNTED